MSLYDFTPTDAKRQPFPLKNLAGKVVLVVNVASACGFTPQYTGLQALYDKYQARGLEIVGFPCNQFGKQEQGTEEEILTFCSTKYSVTFPIMKKIEVNGANTDPLYAFLKAAKGGGDIKWNFEKFLVGKDGKVVDRYNSRKTPAELDSIIASLL
ncbi:glutathione peroxidase [Gonapodya prolifera JEL478]|uniref:Glutathione peroxidase n=1 Tax=Gonapodya prolifera (strain JEL478) TaxID=1344416 RepID=A0A139AAB0_GONPJ|nr:glutathione peroxidase [Gonapodya prolifera JEL478]|eukprot:KXS13638.1 glutathione peroxidase [Gonapodya prolifera JEL478]